MTRTTFIIYIDNIFGYKFIFYKLICQVRLVFM